MDELNYDAEDKNPTAKEIAQTFMSVLSNIEQEVGNDATLEEIITELKKELKIATESKRKTEIQNSIKIAEILLKQQQIIDLEFEKAQKTQEKTAFGYDPEIGVLDQERIENAKDDLEAQTIAAEAKKKKRGRKKKGEQEFIDIPDELKEFEIKDKKTKDGKEIGKADPREKGGMEHHTQRIR